MNLHPHLNLTGRAVTAQMVPLRPDLNDVVQQIGEQEGRTGSQNNWVIDSLGPNDVLVVDLFGRRFDLQVLGEVDEYRSWAS